VRANELEACFEHACATRCDYLISNRLRSPANLCWQYLCIQRQAAAVRMFLRFFRLGVLAHHIGERDVRRLVTEADAKGLH
jgi:hypothetical protein